MAPGFKRGGVRGGGFKRGVARKRASPDEEESVPPASKKARGEAEDTEPFIPTLEEDDKGEKYVPLRANGMRRVAISDFKNNTLVSIREYWTNDAGEVLPGKKGISLTLEQYNTLVTAIPLIESVLKERGNPTVRPDYDGMPAAEEDEDNEEHEEEDLPVKVDDDSDEEDEN